jgi:hypothetical protein
MTRTTAAFAVLAAALTLAMSAAAAVSLTVSPPIVARGGTAYIRGNAGGCPRGATVFVLSRAFPHTHMFAGVPAVLAKVGVGGRFRATTRIPLALRIGRYRVTARCGGGNLGVLAWFTVGR